MGTGPYRLVQARENDFIYDRRDDWWGGSAGFRELPQPKRLVWVGAGVEENRSLLAANSELDAVGGITLGAFEAISAMNPNMIAWKKRCLLSGWIRAHVKFPSITQFHLGISPTCGELSVLSLTVNKLSKSLMKVHHSPPNQFLWLTLG